MDPVDRELPPELFDSALRWLEELTAISSPSGDRAGLLRMAKRLGEALAERGLEPEISMVEARDSPDAARAGRTETRGPDQDSLQATPVAGAGRGEAAAGGLPVLVARPSRGPLGRRGRRRADRQGGDLHASTGHLLLIGHLDTVLPAAVPRRRDGALVATGAVDMKGGFATLLGALDLLALRGVAPAADLVLVAVPDEEVGGELSRAAVEQWGEAARALWVLEPGEPGSVEGAETVVAGRRGLFNWRLSVRGQAAHAGLHYWDGKSALAAAARWCTEAERLSRPGAGPTVCVARLVAGEAGFVTDLATAHPLLGSDRQLNLVPDRALAEGEARFLTRTDCDLLTQRLAALAAEIGATTGTALELECAPPIPPVDPSGPQRANCERAVRFATARGWTLEIEDQRGGISFPNFLPDPGRLPILDGLGPIGGGMHTRAEYVDLRSLRRRISLLADLLREDAQSPAQPIEPTNRPPKSK